MSVWLDDGDIILRLGDAETELRALAEGSVQTIVTSPPYYKLRDYGVEGQLGQERTPDAYTQNLGRVFNAAWHALRADGTLWLNLGDTYHDAEPLLIPHGSAFLLRHYGWKLRQTIVWHKPNAMTESVEHRPTTDYEYVFLFTKPGPYAYYKANCLEPHQPDGRKQTTIAGNGAGVSTHENYANRGGKNAERWPGDGRNMRSVWTIPTQPYHGAHFATFPEELARRCILLGSKPGDLVCDPFVGSGTTCLVARRHERRSIGIDLDEHALRLAADRTKQRSLLIG